MTSTAKTEYVDTYMEALKSPSRYPYLVTLILFSLVASCKQRDGLVGFSFVSKYQKTAMSKSCKTHKAPTCTYDVFDLSVKTFCHGICTPIFPSVQNIGHTFVYRFYYRACLRYVSAPCNRYLTPRSLTVSTLIGPTCPNIRRSSALCSNALGLDSTVVLSVILMFVLLSEGADCHRDLKRALLSLKIPIENTGGQGYLSLYSINTKACPIRSTVRLSDSGKGTKRYTIQKQAENTWIDKRQ